MLSAIRLANGTVMLDAIDPLQRAGVATARFLADEITLGAGDPVATTWVAI
jgi:hypothetical protein